MVSTVKRRTANYNLGIASFDTPVWQLLYENAMDVIDAALFALSGIGNVVGVWDNATGYTLTQRVVDDTDNTMWECITAHTSEATGTFAADRAANAGRWQQVVSTFYNGGEWATGTDYNANTFVRSGNYLGIVVSSYTSGATYAADVSNGDIVTVVDFTSYISAAQDEVDNAAAQVVLAAAQVTLAAGQVTLATAAADDAADEVTYAAEWADKNEDSPVSVDAGGDGSTTFSAKHWSKKAEATAATVEALPDDTGETSKFLQTDGAGNKSWENPSAEFVDSAFKIKGSVDDTKKVRFEVDGLTTEVERTATWPDKDGTVAMISDIPSAIGDNYQEFTSSGTWTKPAGVTWVYVEAIGGGASGAKSSSSGTTTGGGGGGGFNSIVLLASDLSATETVTVGAGGTAVTGSNASGNDGGDSSFGSHLTAKGGGAPVSPSYVRAGFGGGGEAPAPVNSYPGGGFSSGAGGFGNVYLNGVSTAVGGSCVAGGAGGGGCQSSAGVGGTSQRGGNGGAGNTNADATAGSAPGGGGGACASATPTHYSGAGGAGHVRVWAW
jgi:hypothetical protein